MPLCHPRTLALPPLFPLTNSFSSCTNPRTKLLLHSNHEQRDPAVLIETTPCTMGGLVINKAALDRRGQIVSGLYAAGEVTGGTSSPSPVQEFSL
ncbi:MAG: FAD-binding protein [Firmicutes bacterium]|nr:FAD-binding protein [Bacillota bacterium]